MSDLLQLPRNQPELLVHSIDTCPVRLSFLLVRLGWACRPVWVRTENLVLVANGECGGLSTALFSTVFVNLPNGSQLIGRILVYKSSRKGCRSNSQPRNGLHVLNKQSIRLAGWLIGVVTPSLVSFDQLGLSEIRKCRFIFFEQPRYIMCKHGSCILPSTLDASPSTRPL